MHSTFDNLAIVTPVMLPINIAAAILLAYVVFEWMMDRLDDDDDPDAFA